MSGRAAETAGGGDEADAEGDGGETDVASDPVDEWVGERHRVDSVSSALRRVPDSSVHAVIAMPDAGFSAASNGGRGRNGTASPANAAAAHEEWARACHGVLRPGGHLAAFAGPTTFHRMWSGIEDAGFEIRDTLTVLHRVRGAERDEMPRGRERARRVPSPVDVSLVALARRPLPPSSSVAENLLKHGTGAFDVDSTRVPVDDEGDAEANREFTRLPSDDDGGRYPSTVFLDEPTADLLDEANGESVSSGGRAYHNANDMYSSGWAIEDGHERDPGFGDRGGPSRYFHTLPTREAVLSGTGERPGIDGERAARPDRPGTRAETAETDRTNPPTRTVDDGRRYSLAVLADWLVSLLTREEQIVLEPFAEADDAGPRTEASPTADTVRRVCTATGRGYIGLVSADPRPAADDARGNDGDGAAPPRGENDE